MTQSAVVIHVERVIISACLLYDNLGSLHVLNFIYPHNCIHTGTYLLRYLWITNVLD